jgi:hypothetical protein
MIPRNLPSFRPGFIDSIIERSKMSESYDKPEPHSLGSGFQIYEHQLSDLHRQQCFTLGVEYGAFFANLETGQPFKMTVHSDNRKRLTDTAMFNNRKVTWRWENDDLGSIEVTGHKAGKKVDASLPQVPPCDTTEGNQGHME